jgi:hypothetical protein
VTPKRKADTLHLHQVRCQLGRRSRAVLSFDGGGTAMTMSLKSSRKLIFFLLEPPLEKNGLIRSPINDDLPWANTWATPQISLFTGRSHHHDA